MTKNDLEWLKMTKENESDKKSKVWQNDNNDLKWLRMTKND